MKLKKFNTDEIKVKSSKGGRRPSPNYKIQTLDEYEEGPTEKSRKRDQTVSPNRKPRKMVKKRMNDWFENFKALERGE